MSVVFDPLLSCGGCSGRGWINIVPGLTRPCRCRTQVMEEP